MDFVELANLTAMPTAKSEAIDAVPFCGTSF